MRLVNQPESWWGWHGWNQPEPLSIVEIIQAGTLPPRLAAAFWLGLERGASFIFAADPPGAGKTTILTALLPFARPEAQAYFTQGWGETFALPPRSDGYPTYLMVNEISDHLPVYSWGPYVVRIFELLAEGYSLCTTMHADTAEGVIDQLSGDLGVRPEHLAHLTFVVPMVVSQREGVTLRRVSDVSALEGSKGGVTARSMATWDERNDTFSSLASDGERDYLAQRLGLSREDFDRELAVREAFLEGLLQRGVTSISSVEDAIDEFRKTS